MSQYVVIHSGLMDFELEFIPVAKLEFQRVIHPTRRNGQGGNFKIRKRIGLFHYCPRKSFFQPRSPFILKFNSAIIP